MANASQGETFVRIYAAVCRVPAGFVTTYGDVSREAMGHPRGARTVGWALRALPVERAGDVPWWRVVNASGHISTGGRDDCVPEQQRLLEAEGVVFDRVGRLDLPQYRWIG